DADARRGAAFDGPDESQAEEAAPSFADLGADDDLIEARPAEAFAPPTFSRRRDDVPVIAEPPDPDFDAAPAFEADGAAPHTPAVSVAAPEEEDDVFDFAVEETEDTEPVFAASRPRGSVMTEPTAPTTSFDARAASASAAEDALLDLGQTAAPAAVATAEADDFILDLGFDDGPSARDAGDVFDSPLGEMPGHALSWADAPSAFAEAAHGERPRPFESAPSFEPSPTFEPANSFDASSDSARPEASARHDEAPWRDVVVQDGPQGFAFGGAEPEATGSAPRGFVEPEVVPADEPVPAAVASEFTDGSVEGDLPRSPAAQSSSAEAAPQEPPTAGFAVGQARAGLEAPLRADQLSPEIIDAVARRVVEMMSDQVVREIAWEVVPELAELLVRRKLEEDGRR
ncbi:MAG TPA: hypothetical protein VF586_04080, partial [Pyrinomonadaceae bacterium]